MKKPISKIKLGIGIAIAIVGLVILIIVNCCIHDFFTKDGFQVLGNFMHADYKEKCYFIDDKGEVDGESTFTISGILYDKPEGIFSEEGSADSFSGHMEVDAYPLTLSRISHVGSIIDNDRITFISYRDNKLEHHYKVYILRSKPDIVVVSIQLENGEYLTAVCGKSEEEALANYKQYLEKFFG